MHLALLDLFRAKWTAEIHREWIRSVLAGRPDLNLKQLERTRDLMNSHIRDCLVEGYEYLIETLSLPDEDDRHVLAAGIFANADIILTFNLKDFPAEVLASFGIEAKHPDTFLLSLLKRNPDAVVLAAERQRLNLKNPKKSPEEFLEILRRQGLTKTGELLSDLYL